MESQSLSALSAQSILTVMPSTKSEVRHFCMLLKESIAITDPIKFAVQLAALETIAKDLRADATVVTTIVDEIEKHGKKLTYNGNELQVTEAGTKWSYHDDSVLSDLEAQKEEIDTKIKERQKMLQNLSHEVADAESGEMLYPAIKSSKTIYKVTLK